LTKFICSAAALSRGFSQVDKFSLAQVSVGAIFILN
jgi:hypothetical protein